MSTIRDLENLPSMPKPFDFKEAMDFIFAPLPKFDDGLFNVEKFREELNLKPMAKVIPFKKRGEL